MATLHAIDHAMPNNTKVDISILLRNDSVYIIDSVLRQKAF